MGPTLRQETQDRAATIKIVAGLGALGSWPLIHTELKALRTMTRSLEGVTQIFLNSFIERKFP